jgi:hypothetical protein
MTFLERRSPSSRAESPKAGSAGGRPDNPPSDEDDASQQVSAAVPRPEKSAAWRLIGSVRRGIASVIIGSIGDEAAQRRSV